MTDVELIEHGGWVPKSLDDVAGRALADSNLVEAAPGVAGQWWLQAKNRVGVASIRVPGGENVTVRIAPKIPIARLLFLLGYAHNPKGWRDEDVRLDEEPELVPAFARLFLLQAERALRPGVLKGYREVEETALVMRGRIRHGEQVRRHHGRSVPLEVAYDEYTTDIAENQLLRTACDVLLRMPDGIPRDVCGRLRRQRVQLAEVTPIPRGHTLPEWHPHRLNARYHNALRLAELVLRDASVEHRCGAVTVTGFLFSLWKVFENFVTAALRDALAASGGRCKFEPVHHLDDADSITLKPDLVHYADDGTPLGVADAKYQEETLQAARNARFQMLAYCTALNLTEGHLVYAKGYAPHGSHRVKHAGITIHEHALDLDQPPAGLLDDIRRIAQQLSC